MISVLVDNTYRAYFKHGLHALPTHNPFLNFFGAFFTLKNFKLGCYLGGDPNLRNYYSS